MEPVLQGSAGLDSSAADLGWTLSESRELLADFQKALDSPLPVGDNDDLYAGLDLGTACIMLSVVDAAGRPVAGAFEYAEAVRDGLVVNFREACDIVRKLKTEVEGKLGRGLQLAATAYPPGTGSADARGIRYVGQTAGLEIIGDIDEPSAANRVLQIRDGAVVDIGGGTTGVALVTDGKVTYTADEATGGVHFSLVIAGSRHIPLAQAERMKKDPRQQGEILELVKPVMEKIASIIGRHTRGADVPAIFLCGGTSSLSGIEDVVSAYLGIPVFKPASPMLVTPLGIALFCRETAAARKHSPAGLVAAGSPAPPLGS